MDHPEVEPEKDAAPTYGLLVINHAYNEGKMTFKGWLELSREWALKVIEQYDGSSNLPSTSILSNTEAGITTLPVD